MQHVSNRITEPIFQSPDVPRKVRDLTELGGVLPAGHDRDGRACFALTGLREMGIFDPGLWPGLVCHAPSPTGSGSDYSLQLRVVAGVCFRLGQPRAHARGQEMSPLRGSGTLYASYPGLTPGAKNWRPYGALEQSPYRSWGNRLVTTVSVRHRTTFLDPVPVGYGALDQSNPLWRGTSSAMRPGIGAAPPARSFSAPKGRYIPAQGAALGQSGPGTRAL